MFKNLKVLFGLWDKANGRWYFGLGGFFFKFYALAAKYVSDGIYHI